MSRAPHVSLRSRTAADGDLLFEIWSDLETWEERTDVPPRPATREQFDAKLAQTHAGDDVVSFVVEADGVAVGVASLFDFDNLARHAEAGISLRGSDRGKGIGVAAIAQLVDFGFSRRNLHRVHLQVLASNAHAIRAYEKAGFVSEGRQRQHAWVRGAYVDIIRMGILRTDPAAQ